MNAGDLPVVSSVGPKRIRAGDRGLLCMGLFSIFWVAPRRIEVKSRRPCLASPHAVFAAFNPSRCSTSSRIKNFWIFPVTVIGNSSTNST